MMELETDRRNTRPPSAKEVVTFMQSQEPHDPSNPEHVTRELMKSFPQSALYTRDIWVPGGGKKQLTYVQYQQVIRRLIHATGNRFHVRVVSRESTPWGQSKNGNELAMVSAVVELEIPVLGSSRAATGVQVVTVGSGEDMYKGAVSDGVKKAAQMYGVAIDLAGSDGEDTAPQQDAPQNRSTGAPRHETPRQGSAHDALSGSAQRPNNSAGPTDQQKRALWKISGASRETIAAWCQEIGVASERDLTAEQAGQLITKYGE